MRKALSIVLAVLLTSFLFISCDPNSAGGNGGDGGPKTIVGTWRYSTVIESKTHVFTLELNDEEEFSFTHMIGESLNDSYTGTYSTSEGYWTCNFDTTVIVGDRYMYIKDIDGSNKGYIYPGEVLDLDSDDFDDAVWEWDGENTLTYREPGIIETMEITTLADPSSVRHSFIQFYKDGSDNDLFRYEKTWTASAVTCDCGAYGIGKFYNAVLEKAQISSKYTFSGDSLVFHWFGLELNLTRQ